MRRRSLLTFLAIAASAALALTLADAPTVAPALRRVARLTHAANIPLAPALPPEVLAARAEAPAAPAPAPAGPGLAIAPAPQRFAGPAPVRVAPPRSLYQMSTATGTGTWAVVIGVNDYPGTEYDLRYATNDAGDVVQALAQRGVGSDHILALRDGQVTADVVRAAVTWLTSHAGPESTAVFFYAGHVRKQGASEAIVGADGSSVTDYELANLMRPLAARRAWIAIAACYGGGFTEVLAPGRVLTAAAGPNDIAYESSEFARSYLGEFMVHRALVQGAASRSVQHAFAYAHSAISQQYPNRQPVQYDYSDGNVDLQPQGSTSSYSSPPPSGEPQPPPQDSAPPPSQDPSPPPEDDPPERCSGILRFC